MSTVNDIPTVIQPIPYTPELERDQVFPLLIGIYFSFTLFGISLLQAYSCYRLLGRLSLSTSKLDYFILFSFLTLDFADQIAKGQYFSDLIMNVATIGLAAAYVPGPRALMAVAVFGGLVPLAVHLYYMKRIYGLSRNWSLRARICLYGLLGVCLLISLQAVVFAIISGRVGLRKPIEYPRDLKRGIPIPWLAGDALVDVVLCAIMSIYLLSQRAEIKDSNDVIYRLLALTVETGLFPAAIALLDLGLAIAHPLKPWHFSPNFILGKAYINSALFLFRTTLENRAKSSGKSSSTPMSTRRGGRSFNIFSRRNHSESGGSTSAPTHAPVDEIVIDIDPPAREKLRRMQSDLALGHVF
ncbi:hypothetical protein BT69DRAFT_1346737 [Atractiella rhizophila]|nr:hypothetical protein BT69DRAFT_1346737 [Atractiella rhizophila]